MTIIKIFITVIVILLITYFLYVGNGIFGIEDIYLKKDKAFDDFVGYFLAQDEIKNIVINIKKVDNNCEIINQWGICTIFDFEDKWSKETGEVVKGIWTKIYLDTREEVLEYEGISKENHDYIVDFIRKHNLQSVATDDERSVVEFENGLDGLRYYVSSDNNFKADKEYIKVERISDHWYKYRSDWN